MTDYLKRVLQAVARELAIEARHAENIEFVAEVILIRRLGPLLEAGENMYYEEWEDSEATYGSCRKWRAALEQAVRG